MSYVTNIVLSWSILEDDSKIEEVNTYFKYNQRGFVSCGDDSLPRGWYGGSKMLETPLFIGAFNYVGLEDLREHLRTITFEYPESVQLIIKDQDDDIFRIETPLTPPKQN